MTTQSLSHSPEAGTFSNVVDLAAQRAVRRPVDPFDRLAELSAKVWSELEQVGYPRPDYLPENPLIGKLSERARVKRTLNPSPADVETDFRANLPLPDLSSLSFEDCAAVVKSMACIPFSDVNEILHNATSRLLEHVWTRLLDLDTKRGARVINSAMKAAQRKRLRRNRIGGHDAA